MSETTTKTSENKSTIETSTIISNKISTNPFEENISTTHYSDKETSKSDENIHVIMSLDNENESVNELQFLKELKKLNKELNQTEIEKNLNEINSRIKNNSQLQKSEIIYKFSKKIQSFIIKGNTSNREPLLCMLSDQLSYLKNNNSINRDKNTRRKSMSYFNNITREANLSTEEKSTLNNIIRNLYSNNTINQLQNNNQTSFPYLRNLILENNSINSSKCPSTYLATTIPPVTTSQPPINTTIQPTTNSTTTTTTQPTTTSVPTIDSTLSFNNLALNAVTGAVHGTINPLLQISIKTLFENYVDIRSETFRKLKPFLYRGLLTIASTASSATLDYYLNYLNGEDYLNNEDKDQFYQSLTMFGAHFVPNLGLQVINHFSSKHLEDKPVLNGVVQNIPILFLPLSPGDKLPKLVSALSSFISGSVIKSLISYKYSSQASVEKTTTDELNQPNKMSQSSSWTNRVCNFFRNTSSSASNTPDIEQAETIALNTLS